MSRGRQNRHGVQRASFKHKAALTLLGVALAHVARHASRKRDGQAGRPEVDGRTTEQMREDQIAAMTEDVLDGFERLLSDEESGKL